MSVQIDKKDFESREIVCTGKRVDNVYPGLSFSSYTSYLKMKDNVAQNKKIFACSNNRDFIQHLETHPPCTLTGDKFPKTANYGWRSICNMEMDRILACGPSRDPVLHRGMFSKVYIRDRMPKPL